MKLRSWSSRDSFLVATRYKLNVLLSKQFKGALSNLRQFLATEIPLKSMKNSFHFTSKAPFVLKIFKFLP